MRVLQRHLQDQGITVTLKPKPSPMIPWIFPMWILSISACGTERSQKAALKHLLPYREAILDACERGVVGLFTGNACDMLGASITDGSGTEHKALGLLPFTTVESADERYTGDAMTGTSSFRPGSRRLFE